MFIFLRSHHITSHHNTTPRRTDCTKVRNCLGYFLKHTPKTKHQTTNYYQTTRSTMNLFKKQPTLGYITIADERDDHEAVVPRVTAPSTTSRTNDDHDGKKKKNGGRRHSIVAAFLLLVCGLALYAGGPLVGGASLRRSAGPGAGRRNRRKVHPPDLLCPRDQYISGVQ